MPEYLEVNNMDSLNPLSDGLKIAADSLQQAGVNAVAYVSPLTAHEWQSWRRSLREFGPLLFKDLYQAEVDCSKEYCSDTK
jgi:hypothetical protein